MIGTYIFNRAAISHSIANNIKQQFTERRNSELGVEALVVACGPRIGRCNGSGSIKVLNWYWATQKGKGGPAQLTDAIRSSVSIVEILMESPYLPLGSYLTPEHVMGPGPGEGERQTPVKIWDINQMRTPTPP